MEVEMDKKILEKKIEAAKIRNMENVPFIAAKIG
jgi:hypothetical protein